MLKHRDRMRREKKNEKEDKLRRKAMADERSRKAELVQTNVKHVKSRLKEKADDINAKFDKIDDRIDKAEKDKRLYSMKHRELGSLK